MLGPNGVLMRIGNQPLLIFISLFLLSALALPSEQERTPPADTKKAGNTMANHAKGEFDVKITPTQDKTPDPALGRLLVEKKYHGDVDASSVGEMLTSGNGSKSGGYVLIERVTGTLNGKRGSFSLQHSGIMDNGVPNLNIIVVPGSGTDQLDGISGKFSLDIKGGKHFYDLEYTLPGAK
jgi:hypothetical protein